MSNYRPNFISNRFYHIYNRGNQKERIFFEESDYKRFVFKMYRYQKKFEKCFQIIEWCLLPNHFHILVINLVEGLDFAKFMMHLQISHSVYIKRKYAFSGDRSLFEGRYKANVLEDSEAITSCREYILNNPVKHGYVKDYKDWEWSSFARKGI